VRLPCPRLSEPLRRQALFWANRLSFGAAARLLGEVVGAAVLSEDGLWRLAQGEAQSLDEQQRQAIQDAAGLPEPEYVATADLYQVNSPESVVMTDGIGVKAQKPTRDKRADPEPTRDKRADPEPTRDKRADPEPTRERDGEAERTKTEKAKTEKAKKAPGEKRHDTDVLILPRKDGGEQVVCEGVSGRGRLVVAARAYLRREWSGATLPVIALTDGAKAIRADLYALFGDGVQVVLDWYHLAKRVYQQLSMAAHSMKEREGWEKQVLAWLWRGDVTEARTFLANLTGRNAKALADLIGWRT
jgi:hypothetical protein